jgi:hypothetical protein
MKKTDSDMAMRIKGYERPISRVARCLGGAGLIVVRSFDFQSSRIAMGNFICECPYHGTRHCDCQVAVLLVYGENGTPATLLMHGRNQKTKFSLVNTPQYPVDPGLEALIISTLSDAHIPFSDNNT